MHRRALGNDKRALFFYGSKALNILWADLPLSFAARDHTTFSGFEAEDGAANKADGGLNRPQRC